MAKTPRIASPDPVLDEKAINKKLTTKEALFVRHYLLDQNATAAAINAGYSEKTAGSIGSENLKKPHIAAEISRLSGAAHDKLDLSVERLLKRANDLAFGDLRKLYAPNDSRDPEDKGDLRMLHPSEWPDEVAASIAGFEVIAQKDREGYLTGDYVVKVKMVDRRAALDMLFRHKALYNDKLDVNVTDDLAGRLARAKARKERRE